MVYKELRRHAAVRMAQEVPGQTLQPTALVHEAWLRLSGEGNRRWQNRAHFFGAAAEAMRRILIERARHKARLKRGGNPLRLDVEKLDLAAASPDAAGLGALTSRAAAPWALNPARSPREWQDGARLRLRQPAMGPHAMVAPEAGFRAR